MVVRKKNNKRNVVYLLEHVHDLPDDAYEVKTIGIYSTNAHAEEAVARLSSQDGFRDYPNGFNIDEYLLDEDNWSEGFVAGDLPPSSFK